MEINANNIVSITEANQNFSRVMRMAERGGSVVIMRNNRIVGRLIAEPGHDGASPKRKVSSKNKRISKGELARSERKTFGRFISAFRELADK